jgi:hypothetical protein
MRVATFLPVAAVCFSACYAATPLDEAALLRQIRQHQAAPGTAARQAAQAIAEPLTETDAILRANADNPFLRAERTRIPVALADVRKARVLQNPEIRVSNGWAEEGDLSEDRFNLDFRWSPDPLLRHLAEVDVAMAGVPESKAEVALRAWEVRGEVRLAWTRAAYGRLRAAVDEERAAVRREIRDRLAAAPGVDPVERLRAEVAVQEAEDRARRRQAEEQDALLDLARRMGLGTADGLTVVIPPDPLACPAPPGAVPEAIDAVAKDHPRVRLARAAYAVAEAELKVEYARRIPWIRWIQIGWAYRPGTPGDNPDRNDLRLGASLDLPILDWNQGGVASGEARRNRSAEQFRTALAEVVADADASRSRWAIAADRLARLRIEAPALADRAMAMTQDAVRSGRLSGLDLQKSRLEALDLREALVQAALACRESVIAAESCAGLPADETGGK